MIVRKVRIDADEFSIERPQRDDGVHLYAVRCGSVCVETWCERTEGEVNLKVSTEFYLTRAEARLLGDWLTKLEADADG